MSKLLLKSIILVLLLGSIFTTYAIQQVDASSSLVTITSTNTGNGITTLSLNNNSTSNVVSFILQINDGTFKSFKIENGWFGEKTASTLAFSAINPLKPGKTTTFEIKTDQTIPVISWKASDANNIVLGSGTINTQSSTSQITKNQSQNDQSLSQTPSSETQIQSLVKGILDTSTFRIIPSTPNAGSHVRVVGVSFSPSTNLDLYIGNDKIDSFLSNGNGNFVTTAIIPTSEQPGNVNFILKDQQGNQRSFSTTLKVQPVRGTPQNVPLTINIDPIFHRGETKIISGTATPGSTITLTLFDSKGNSITTSTLQPDKNGNYSVKHTVPIDREFGKYSITASDGKNQASKEYNVVTIHNISVTTSAQRYEPGQTVSINGTSISNQIVNFVFDDSTGHPIYSSNSNVTSGGSVSASYKLPDSAIRGTYTVIASQGNDTSTLYFGVGENTSPPISANMDKLNYAVTDKPVISVTGPPSSTLNLVVVDPSDKQKFADVINLGSDGQAIYSFNLTAYTSGIYSAVVSHAEQKIQKDFAVGLAGGSGTITLKTIKDSYLPGDPIIIIGSANSNSLIQISLIDPNGIIAKSLTTFSDKTGHFSSFDFKIPPIATPGTWKLDGTSGINHNSIPIIVKSSTQGIIVKLDRSSGIYTRGDVVTVSGTDAGVTASVKITIGNNGTLVDSLTTSATNRGEYSTAWQVPRNVNPGTYTIEASSVTGKATISITFQ